MIIDKELEFSNEQAVTATAVSTNIIDQGAPRGMSQMGDAKVVITVTEDATAAGAATVKVQLQESAAENMGSPTTVDLTAELPKADLVVGKQIACSIPAHFTKRYLRLNYVVGTGPLTAGKFTAQITNGYSKPEAYPQSSKIG